MPPTLKKEVETLDEWIGKRIRESINPYPLLWWGKRTPPRIVGLGYLIQIEDEKEFFVERILWTPFSDDVKLGDEDDPVFGKRVIVLGGCSPKLIEYYGYLIAKGYNIPQRYLEFKVLEANGLSFKHYVLLYKELRWQDFSFDGEIIFKPIEQGEIEIYHPPCVWWIKVNDGRIEDVELLTK